MSAMVGHRQSSSDPSVRSLTNVNAEPSRRSAENYRFTKSKFPPVDDYVRACGKLVWDTFPGDSVNAKADEAEKTGLASADTFARIMTKGTKRVDGRLMNCVLRLAVDRGIRIPDPLAIRIAMDNTP